MADRRVENPLTKNVESGVLHVGCRYDVLSVPPVIAALPADPALTEYLDALDELFSEVNGTEYEVLSALSDEEEVW